MIFWSALILAADSNSTSSSNSNSSSSNQKLICNQQPATVVTWKTPDPNGSTKVEQIPFGTEYTLKWQPIDTSVSVNYAVQLSMPGVRLFATIKVVGNTNTFKWTPSPSFNDDVTGQTVNVQNAGGYMFVLHDNSTSTDAGCVGQITDSSSKPIQFFTPGGDQGGSRRSPGSILVLQWLVSITTFCALLY